MCNKFGLPRSMAAERRWGRTRPSLPGSGRGLRRPLLGAARPFARARRGPVNGSGPAGRPERQRRRVTLARPRRRRSGSSRATWGCVAWQGTEAPLPKVGAVSRSSAGPCESRRSSSHLVPLVVSAPPPPFRLGQDGSARRRPQGKPHLGSILWAPWEWNNSYRKQMLLELLHLKG